MSRRGARRSPGAVIAVIGVALALAVLLLTLSVTLGFKNSIRERLCGFDAQITVLPPFESGAAVQTSWIRPDSVLLDILTSRYPEAEIRAAIRQPGILKTAEDFQGVVFQSSELLKESPSVRPFDFERQNIVEGEWPDFQDASNIESLVLSVPVARSLGLSVGDKVYSTFFLNGQVKGRRHELVALYESNFDDFDQTVAYVSGELLRRVSGQDDGAATRMDIRALPLNVDLEEARNELQQDLTHALAMGELDALYPVTDIMRTSAEFFNWLALLDTNVVVIFILILSVAALTLISCLFILALDRMKEIATLRGLGAGNKLISRIFVWMAMRLVGRGILIGDILGLAVILIQYHTHIMPLNQHMYYLNHVPVALPWIGFILINVGVALLSWLVLILPARAARSLSK